MSIIKASVVPNFRTIRNNISKSNS